MHKPESDFDNVGNLYRRCRAYMVKQLQAEGASNDRIANHLTLTTNTMTAFIKCSENLNTPAFALNEPKYMFAERPVTPSTWMELQRMQLDTYMLADHTALLVDPVTRDYCYVYWDEVEQCSNPYPSQAEALMARMVYMTNL